MRSPAKLLNGSDAGRRVRSWTGLYGIDWKPTRIWRKAADVSRVLIGQGKGWKKIHPVPGKNRQPASETDLESMFDELNDLYQQVILDHCKRPRNFHEMPGATRSAQGHNPLCGDQLKLFLAMDGDRIKEASFVGSGCCISKASASLLTESVKGRTRAEVQQMFDQVHEMVMTGDIKGEVGKLAVFAGVHKFPARVKCAILAWHAVMAALKGEGNHGQPVTTES